jgi:hypothetical protein
MAEPISENQETPNADREPKHDADSPIDQVSGAGAEPEPPIAQSKGNKTSNKERDWFDYTKGVLEIIGLAVLCVYTAYTVKIFRANKSAADAAVASIRPWIKIIGAEPQDKGLEGSGDLDFGTVVVLPDPAKRMTADIRIKVSAKNIGHSVALKAAIHGKMTFSDNSDELLKEQALVCAGKLHSSPPPWPINIYPEEDSQDLFFILGAEYVPPRSKLRDIVAGQIPSEAWGSKNAWLVSPKFIGCVTYTIPATGALVYSNFSYYLGQRYRDNVFGEYTPRFFIVGKNVPMKSLILSAYGAEGFYSN